MMAVQMLLKILIWLLRHHPDTAFVEVITHREIDDNGIYEPDHVLVLR